VDDCVEVRVRIAMGDVKHRLNNHAYEMCAAGRRAEQMTRWETTTRRCFPDHPKIGLLSMFGRPEPSHTIEDSRSNSILVDKGGRCALYAGHKCVLPSIPNTLAGPGS
jgi:hypothetical protein